MKEDNDWSSAVCHTVCQRLFLRMCFCMRLIWLSQHVNWLPRLMSKNVKIMKSKPVDIWTHLVCLEAEYTRDTGIPKNCNLNGKNMQKSFKIYIIYIIPTNFGYSIFRQSLLMFSGSCWYFAGLGWARHTTHEGVSRVSFCNTMMVCEQLEKWGSDWVTNPKYLSS